MTNLTHDPTLRSWVESANAPDTDFPIQNLPFCVFSDDQPESVPRGGVAIGDHIVDLAVCADANLFQGRAADAVYVAAAGTLNEFMAMEPAYHAALRAELSALLSGDGATHRGIPLPEEVLCPMDGVYLHTPARIGNYTDFYASVHHATNVGSMFRPDNPLLPNYKYVPIGYHGRASSITLNDAVVRPHGQTKPPGALVPTFGPCTQLDYELEVGVYVGHGNMLGAPIPTAPSRSQNPRMITSSPSSRNRRSSPVGSVMGSVPRHVISNRQPRDSLSGPDTVPLANKSPGLRSQPPLV